MALHAGNAVPSDSEPIIDEDEYIDSLTLKAAMALTKEQHIERDKSIQKLPDLRNLIKLHYVQQKGQTKDVASLVLLQLRKEDEIRRETLFNICDRVRELADVLKTDDELVHNQLSINLPAYEDVMREHMGRIQESYCPVLIIGESCAGKSSFINLLLGEEVLPSYHLSNTSVICEIQYSETHHATIYPWQGEEKVVITEDDLDQTSPEGIRSLFVTKLASYIQEKEVRDNWKYKRAKIGLPCAVLKTGLCIVDSPGIGENEELTKLVLEYMFTSFAFIYIINSNNAGGLQSDRIQVLVKALVKERKRNNGTHFLPQSAMFICNKWDLLPIGDRVAVINDTVDKLKMIWPGFQENQLYNLKITMTDTIRFILPIGDRAAVINDTVDKLKMIWPGFQENQLYKMSTKDAMYMMRHNYTSSQLMRVLQGLQTMIPLGLEGRIAHSYDYFSFLVHRVIKSSSTFIQQNKMTVEQRLTMIYEIETRLKKMKQDSNEFFQTQWKTLHKNRTQTVQLLRKHFQLQSTIDRICGWHGKEIPQKTTWKEIELAIRAKTYERITKEISRLEEVHAFFRNKRQNLLDEFRKTFMLLESKLMTIENIMAGDDTLSLSLDLEEEKSEDRGGSILSSLGWNYLSRSVKVAVVLTSPILAPIALVGFICSLPVLGVFKIKEGILHKKMQDDSDNFNINPTDFLKKYSLELLNRFTSESNLKKFVKEELQVVHQFLDQLQHAEHVQRESDVYLLEQLRDEDTSEIVDCEQHVKVFEKYSNILSRLQWFKVTQMLRRDMEFVKTNTADVQHELLNYDTQNVICNGLKAMIYRGSFTDVKVVKPVAVRILNIPVSPSNITEYIKEEKGYRYANEPSNIMKLIAVTKDFRQVFQMFEDLHSSLRVHALQKRRLLDDEVGWEVFITRVATSVTNGLRYLHARHRVHYDLSMDTIAVTSSGQVKLTNISCQTSLDDLTRKDILANLHRPSLYLPPEILHEERPIYTDKCDIYCLGLLLWELSTCLVAFDDVINDPKNCIKTGADFFGCLSALGVRQALNVDGRNEISELWKGVIVNCVATEQMIRNSSAVTLDNLTENSENTHL